jgi:hypothetical protein
MSTDTPSRRVDLDDGSSLLMAPVTDGDLKTSVEQQLRRSTETPTPGGRRRGTDDGGPVRRVTNASTVFGIAGLRTLALQSHELGDAIRTRRDELYRNEFPKLKPRFVTKCPACESEFDREPDACPACGHDELRRPDPSEKREAESLFESVNKEGQSLRELAKYAEVDQWVAGVSTLVIQYEYAIAQDSALYEDGAVIDKEPTELVYADPNTVVPVVDDDNRIGGHWWTCPIHREDVADEPGRCDRCNAERREVFFVEEQRGSDDRYFFRDEVVTWASPMPRLNGLDGLAPAAEVVVRQVILDMMTRYGAAFYDQNSDRLPNQLMILHTTNADQWEDQISRVRDEDDPYDSPILANEYSPDDSSTPELQIVDAMPDELLGQSEALKQDYKEDIRQAIGISNVHDSDLSDAGGLNNEGLQLEVTDRSIASQQHDYVEGWLDTLAKRLDLDDWYIAFLPSTGPDAAEQKERVRAGALAAQAGLDARWDDGDLEIDDGAFGAPDPDAGPKARLPDETSAGDPSPDGDGGRGQQAAARSGPDATSQQAGPEPVSTKQAADLLADAFRHIVWAPPVDGTEQQAEPFWSRSADVPANVERHIRTAIAKTDLTMADDVSASTLTPYFREKLLQPQGWSLQSLANGLVREHDLAPEYANTVARSGAARILNQAKADAFAELEGEAGQEVLYYWRGPADADTSDGCAELKQLTNPEFGGRPRPLAEFRDLQRQIHDEYYDGLRFDAAAMHPNERHTLEATLASDIRGN